MSFPSSLSIGTPCTVRGRVGRVVTSRMQVETVDACTEPAPKLFDCHSHFFASGYSTTSVYDFTMTLAQCMRRQLLLVKQAGVRYMLCMGIPTHIEGGPLGCACDCTDVGRTYYARDGIRDGTERLTVELLQEMGRARQYYDTSVDWQMAMAWKSLSPEEQGCIKLALTGINLDDPHGIHAIMWLKLHFPNLFHWVGEITLFKEVVQLQNGALQLGFTRASAIHKYLTFFERASLGVTIHCDLSDTANCLRTGGRGGAEHLAILTELFTAHPGTTIVWAHMGLGKFTPPPPNHVEIMAKLLDACPNLHIDLSWDAVALHYSPNPQPSANMSDAQREGFDPVQDAGERRQRTRALAALVERYPERFSWGSDALGGFNSDQLLSAYKVYCNHGQGRGGTENGLFDYLSHRTLDCVRYKNFKRLYRARRAGSRLYEAGQMQEDMAKIQRAANPAGRRANHW